MSLTRRGALGAVAAAAFMGGAAPAAALSEDEAQRFVTVLVDELLAIVRMKGPLEETQAAFLEVFRKRAAMDAIARFTAGRSWREMNEAQQARYLDVFRRYAARVYASRIGEYQGQTVEVIGARDVGRRGVLVQSELKWPDSEDIAVEWLVSDRSGPPLLVDIVAEGVSLSISQREEFAAMVERRRGDLDLFIDDLDTLG